MTLKICSTAHISTLVDVSIQSYREHYTYLWYDEGKKYIADNFNSESFKQQLTDANVALFLIYDEKKEAAGFLKLNIDKAYENYESQHTLELERIYLTKRASGKGLGKKVMDFAASFARDKNKKYILLKVMDSSPAVNFYRSAGFEIIGPWRLTFPEMKEEFRGMHVMVKELV